MKLLTLKGVDQIAFKENLSKVEMFFNDFRGQYKTQDYIDLSMVSRRFRGAVRSVFPYGEKIFFKKQEKEDEEFLAEAVCLKGSGDFYINSLDEHFHGSAISSAIEQNFGIKCKSPDKLLQEIRQH